ncbi:MAG TPA: alpha/beta fold hydrolase [Solirubrobacteraceae bacterium]|nr:alpha/beta fold hydrolase [Solirubrobacteraceae bacterium]
MRPPPQRSQLRRLLEVRGVIGGHRGVAYEVRLRAADGVRLAASWLPAADPAAPGVVLAHGFAAHRRKPAYAALADVLAARGHHVLSLDLRGHGRSGGVTTFGDREALDVAAGVRWLRARAVEQVHVVGVSMGASAVLHAAATAPDVEAVVVVSSPAWVGRFETEAMLRLDRIWRGAWSRPGFTALTGVRMVRPRAWRRFEDPEALARRIGVPLLVVHGDDDEYFDPAHARALVAAAGGPSTYWREPRFGHAEDGLDRGFGTRLADALHEVARTGRFPEHGAAVGSAAAS